MLQVLSDLFINVTILVSLIFFANQLYRDASAKISSKLLRELIIGSGFGVIGIITMVYSFQTIRGFLIDFPNIAVMVSAIYTSLPAAVAAATVIYLARIFIFSFDPHLIPNLLMVFMTAIGCGLISRLNIKRLRKWVLSYFWMCTHFILILLFFSPVPFHLEIIFVYCVGTAVVLLVLYYFMEYIMLTNQTYYEIREAADKDYLTGLNNVRQYDKLLNNALQNSKENNEHLSILFLDVDYFKKINDSYGHLEGDRILQEISALLRKNSRPEDIISRNGGEEFSLILIGCSLEQAVKVAERIRKSVDQHDFMSNTGEIIQVTVSIGISSFPDTTWEAEKLVEQADSALYTAKKNGRNRVAVARGIT